MSFSATCKSIFQLVEDHNDELENLTVHQISFHLWMNIRQRNDPGRWTAILQGKCRKQGWKNSGFAVHLRGSFLCLSMLKCFKVTNSWLCSSQQSNRWNRTDPINAWSCQSAGTPRAATIVLWLECVSVEFRPFPSTNPPNADCSLSMWTSYDRRRTFGRFCLIIA